MKSKKVRIKKNEGITLISLVITIVVLIILTSVAIYFSLGNNGIFVRSKQAKELTNKQTATEKMNLKITTAQMNKYAEKQEMPTLKELSEILRDDEEIEYVTEETQMASTKYEVGENPSSIFTKLNEYPYEFEINSSLQLASINGVKINDNEESIKTGITAYVVGVIGTYNSSGNQYASSGFSSDSNYFTCEGAYERNYLLVNIIKDMNIVVSMTESARGNYSKITTYVNNISVNSTSVTQGSNNTFEITVHAGDVIKIVQQRQASNMKALGIRNILYRIIRRD